MGACHSRATIGRERATPVQGAVGGFRLPDRTVLPPTQLPPFTLRAEAVRMEAQTSAAAGHRECEDQNRNDAEKPMKKDRDELREEQPSVDLLRGEQIARPKYGSTFKKDGDRPRERAGVAV